MHLQSRRHDRRPKLDMTADSDSGVTTAREVIGVGMSVTPFLPPPFGPGATGLLAVFNFVLGLKNAPTPPKTPLQELKESLEAYYAEEDLNTQLAILAGQRKHFVNSSLVTQPPPDNTSPPGEAAPALNLKPIDQLTAEDIEGDIADLLTDLGSPATTGMLKAVSDANDQIWKRLKMCTSDNFDETLGSLISGVTLQLTLENAWIEITAINASFASRHKDMHSYGTSVSKWTGRINGAANDIGKSHIGAWDEASIEGVDGLQSTSYIPGIEAWMAQAKAQRLQQISDVHRSTWSEEQWAFDPNGGHATQVSHNGWSWNDAGDPENQSDKANMQEDTDGEHFWSDPVEHKDPAVASHDAYVEKISQKVDDGFKSHRDLMQTWLTFLDGFHELLPPDAPPSPQASPMQGGSAVPQGAWVEGAEVQYALSAVNKKGPSALSDWSDSFKIGKTAFATLTGLGPAPAADSLTIYRQIRPPGEQWSDPIATDTIQSPFPPTYNDTFVGDDY